MFEKDIYSVWMMRNKLRMAWWNQFFMSLPHPKLLMTIIGPIYMYLQSAQLVHRVTAISALKLCCWTKEGEVLEALDLPLIPKCAVRKSLAFVPEARIGFCIKALHLHKKLTLSPCSNKTFKAGWSHIPSSKEARTLPWILAKTLHVTTLKVAFSFVIPTELELCFRNKKDFSHDFKGVPPSGWKSKLLSQGTRAIVMMLCTLMTMHEQVTYRREPGDAEFASGTVAELDRDELSLNNNN